MYLQKELEYLQDQALVEEACEYGTMIMLSPGDKVKILKPTILLSLEWQHIIAMDCIGVVDYVHGQWVFVTTDLGFQHYHLPSGLTVMAQHGIGW